MGAGVQYKILFVGLGSIGQKHLENLYSILNEKGINFQIDALRKNDTASDKITNIYTKCEQVPNDYDIIFITNPTNLHFEAIENLKTKTKNMFIEKPIFEKIYDLKTYNGIYYVACPLRFHPVIKFLKEFAENNNIISFRAICSSYLPEWRKNCNYKECYSSKKEMGGGVELDLIHEIDYLKWIFGSPVKSKILTGKKSGLEINSNDIAQYIFEFENLIGSLHLDYFGQYASDAKREIEIFTNDETLIFDIKNNCVKFLKKNIVKNFDAEDIYKNEMNYFLDIINNKEKDYYNPPKEALESLQVALEEKL